jgi:hypothetical protein
MQRSSKEYTPDDPLPSELPVKEDLKPSYLEDRVDSPALSKAIGEAHAVISHTADGKIFVKSAKGDPESPRSWPNWKRYGIAIFASWLNNLVCSRLVILPSFDTSIHFFIRSASALAATVRAQSRYRRNLE